MSYSSYPAGGSGYGSYDQAPPSSSYRSENGYSNGGGSHRGGGQLFPGETGFKVYIGNLSYETAEGKLRSVCERYGPTANVKIPMDRETGRPKGYAFVDFQAKEGMQRAIKELDGTQLDGRSIRVAERTPGAGPQRGPGGDGGRDYGSSRGDYDRGSSRGDYDRRGGGGGYADQSSAGGYRGRDDYDRGSGRGGGRDSYGGGSSSYREAPREASGGNRPDDDLKIYVGNISWNSDREYLIQEFSKYGKVVDARIIHDKETGRSKGYGFVTFSSMQGVNDAIKHQDGKLMDGRMVKVSQAGGSRGGEGPPMGRGGYQEPAAPEYGREPPPCRDPYALPPSVPPPGPYDAPPAGPPVYHRGYDPAPRAPAVSGYEYPPVDNRAPPSGYAPAPYDAPRAAAYPPDNRGGYGAERNDYRDNRGDRRHAPY